MHRNAGDGRAHAARMNLVQSAFTAMGSLQVTWIYTLTSQARQSIASRSRTAIMKMYASNANVIVASKVETL